MSGNAAVARDEHARLDAWCGWCLAGLLALTPLAAWLGPLAYAPLAALAGLLTLPAARITEEDRPLTIAIMVLVVWACGSILWSPYRAPDLEGQTGLKLALQAPLYWAVICAARRASPTSQVWALRIFAWGMAALGVMMLAEALTGASLYQALHKAFEGPIRPDLAAKNVAKGAVILAVLWAPAAAAAWRIDGNRWLGAPMLIGLVAAGFVFKADAPLVAVTASLVAGLAVWTFPRMAPRLLGALAGLMFLATPGALGAARGLGWFEAVQRQVETSWSQRVGYWSHAIDWIGDHPLRGWGLDASRMFGPGIQLHPHDAALQVWLELGLIGAMAAAVFWTALFMRLSRASPSLPAAAGAASAAAYLVFGAVSFGVWQEWWLALGAIAAAAVTALARHSAPPGRKDATPLGARTSTFAP